jgi:hypothetical protein
MTLFLTETHLTSDPRLDNEIMVFDIAFSLMSVQCQSHRQENMEYVEHHQIRTGDKVMLQGVFVTIGPNVYINVHFIELTNNQTGKKRKLQQMQEALDTDALSLTPSSPSSEKAKPFRTSHYNTIEKAGYNFIEITGCFKEYFFMLYGKAYYVCDMSTGVVRSEEERAKIRADVGELMYKQLSKIVTLHEKILKAENPNSEATKSDILDFIIAVKGIMIDIHDKFIKFNCSLPEYLRIDSSIPLPSSIYNYYINL